MQHPAKCGLPEDGISGGVITVAPLVVSRSSRQLDAVPLAGVASGDVPHIVSAPRCRHREPGEGRRVVANAVCGKTVAVTPVATSCRGKPAPPQVSRCRPFLEVQGVDVEGDPVRRNERARTVDQDGGVVRCLRLTADADLAEVVALQEPVGLQNRCTTGRYAARWVSGSTAGPGRDSRVAPRTPWSIVSESQLIASRCST